MAKEVVGSNPTGAYHHILLGGDDKNFADHTFFKKRKSAFLYSTYFHTQNTYRTHTWGTETSKYPEEKKQICIPSVAASEIGGAQMPHLLEISLKFPKGAAGCRTESSLEESYKIST